MRWIPWLLAVVGIAQFAILGYTDTAPSVSDDMAYLVMALSLLAAAATCAMCCGWGCYGYGSGGCGCDHCDGCAGDDCCGNCGCRDGGHSHEHGKPGEHSHEGHSH